MSGTRLATAFQTLVSVSRQTMQVESPSIKNAQLPVVADAIRIDRVQSKPTSDTNLLEKWADASKHGKLDMISNRDLRRLSWEPGIVLTSEYLDELSSRNPSLSRSLLKGLIYSLLSAWEEKQTKGVKKLLQDGLNLDTTSAYLRKVAPFILSDDGHAATAKALIANQSSVQKTISEIFGISATATSYAQAVFSVVVETGHGKVLSANIDERQWFYSEVLQQVNKQVLLQCLERVVAVIDSSRNETAKEEFKKFVLFHPNLGDPRLPGYEGNWPKEGNLTAKVIEWLSQSDIRFFFELFIEKKSDVQGRKQFWLKYAHLVKGTRVIVSSHDEHALARQITEMKQKSGTSNLFASLKESSEKSTAFMMDFGKLIVVEFGRAGHACYFYGNQSGFRYKDRTQFWGAETFSTSGLKDRNTCTTRMSHYEGWEDKFENELARFGLRPKMDSRR